jgi:peptidoglycan/LPS O-acetylase OafA/YrhL
MSEAGGALRQEGVPRLADRLNDPPPHALLDRPAAISNPYRADIDGLRAVAVLAVLFFHLPVPGFSGGFVGVDVFFVISGFLITGLIKADMAAGRFGLAHFYSQRVRRLLPAYFVTAAISSAAAFLLLAPQHLKNFADSLLAANFGVSNILFWRESGYFDLAARMKPLLHTWSLGVEWQFYLVWPFFLSLLLTRFRRLMPLAILAIAVLSFCLRLVFQDGSFWPLSATRAGDWIADGPATVFYNTPFRIFEFACGALLVWFPKPRHIIAHELLSLVGLALIGGAVFLLDGGATSSAWRLLAPVIGAALVIHADRSRTAGLVLRNRPTVYVGRISYSLYLIHWPLLVFYEYAALRPLRPGEMAFIGVLAVALAVLMFHLVEQPYRARRSFIPLSRLTIAGLAALSLVGISMSGGMPWRLNSVAAGTELADSTKLRAISGSLGCRDFCEFGNLQSPRKILVVGDSHVDHYTRALEALGGNEFHFLLAEAGNCYFGADLQTRTASAVVEHCRTATDQATRWLKAGGIMAVVQGQRWPGYRNLLEQKAGGAHVDMPDLARLFPTMFADIAKRYAGFQGPIILLGHAPSTDLICDTRPSYFSLPCPKLSRIEHVAFETAFAAFAAAHPRFQLVDPIETICSGPSCRTTDAEGRSLYVDGHHLSIFGAKLIVPKILEKLRSDLPVDRGRT